MNGVHRFGIKGKLAPCYVGPFCTLAKCGEVAYQVEFPSTFPDVHDVFHVSQLKCCFKDPMRGVDQEALDLQEDMSYREYLVLVLDETECKNQCWRIKFLVRLQSEYSYLFSKIKEYWDNIF